MKNEIVVEVRNVFGRGLIYPFNDNARRIAELAGAKTLNANHLELARGLGFEIREVANLKLGDRA